MVLMKREDQIYAVLLAVSVFFGYFYRKIRNVNLKMWTGSVFGVTTVLLTSGMFSLHIFVSFFVSTAIIKIGNKYDYQMIIKKGS